MKRSFFSIAASSALVALLFLGVFSRVGRPPGRSPPPEPTQRGMVGHGETGPLPLGLGRPGRADSFDQAGWVVRPVVENETARPENQDASFVAFQPGRQFQAHFLDNGVRFSPVRGEGWSATLRFLGSSPDSRGPVATGNRVEYEHPDGITEWYVDQPGGLEHGLTVRQPSPMKAPDSGLRLEFALAGLKARPVGDDGNGGAVELVRPEDDVPVLRYDRLVVQDAQGREVPARLEAVGHQVAMVIDDRGAKYPLSVDPWFSSLEARWAPGITGFGRSVALSGDTALVGADFDGGSAHVYVRNAGIWTWEARLTPMDGEAYGFFGQAVALSGDTALVGADSGVWVFVRSGGVWTQQARFGVPGRSVALSGDTALVGDYTAAVDGVDYAGQVHVFMREGEIWNVQAPLVARIPAEYHCFGASVSLAGERALVGAPGGVDAAGASLRGAYAFVRVAGRYWYQQAKLTPVGGHSGDGFGWSVALSGDTALVSASHDQLGSWWHDYGSVYVFERDWAGWTQRAKLTSADPYSYFGYPISVSGEVALVGEFYPPAGAHMWPGRLHLFVRTGSGWSLQGQLTASDFGGHGHFGSSVAMVDNTVLVGACYAENWPEAPVGAAYVFRLGKAVPTITQPPSASSITYGQSLSSSELTGGEADVPGTFAFTDPATVPNAGLASFEVTFTPADTAGYSNAVVMVPVTVQRATPRIITVPMVGAITYGQMLSDASLSGGEAWPSGGTFAFTDPTVAPEAGTALQGVTYTPVDTANYTTAGTMVAVTVDKASLVIRADDQQKVVGSENPPLTASYEGFVHGDSAEVLDVPVSLSTTADVNSPVGSYPIRAQGAVDANYEITHEDGVLAVVEPGIFFCTEVSPGELRSLDVDRDRPGSQYRLIFNSVPKAPGTYRLPSSSPGIFCSAVRYAASPGGGVVSRLSLPMPLRLAGTRPVRVYGNFQARDTGGMEWSIRLGPEITDAFSISITPTADGATVEVLGLMPASGVIGIVLQLENAWKKTVGWTFDPGLNATGTPGTSSAGGRLPQFQITTLSARWGAQTQPEVRYRAAIESENRPNR